MLPECEYKQLLRVVESFSPEGQSFIEQAIAAGEMQARDIDGRRYVSWDNLNGWLACGSDPEEWVEACAPADLLEV